MGNSSFFTTALKYAKQASSQTGVLTSVILAQWADETAYGGIDWSVYNNPGNVGDPDRGGQLTFPTLQAGVDEYISTLNQSNYNNVRQAIGWRAQCVALGSGPHPNQYPYNSWAVSGYDDNGYSRGVPFPDLNFGIDLINIIEDYNLTQYDVGEFQGGSSSTSSSTDVAPTTSSGSAATKTFNTSTVGAPIPEPVPGFASEISSNDVVINGTTVDLIVGDALVNVELSLDITLASTVTLTIHDPERTIINAPEFSQASLLNIGDTWYSLVSVEKEDSVLTVVFESGIIAALRQATGAFSIAPGTMTRTAFANLLVDQISGATFAQASESYLYGLDEGYARTNKEQLSRGTVDAPLEDSWTCLQRLAAEIQWVCYESFGVVYFGPYGYLTAQDPVMWPVEFEAGIGTINGTYDVGQPLGTMTINAVADSWYPTIGQCVEIANLGPFSQGTTAVNWLVSQMDRPSLDEPDITITLMQPLPGLPEPSTGGAQAAVGAGTGNVQTTGGSDIANQALDFALSKVGDAYSETVRLGPDSYDCSGLVYEAYLSAGVELAGTTTAGMWPNGAGEHVPDGAKNLLPGDLLFFGASTTQTEHVAMVHTVDTANNSATCVQATDPALGIQDGVVYKPIKVGTSFGPNLTYLGATRPAP